MVLRFGIRGSAIKRIPSSASYQEYDLSALVKDLRTFGACGKLLTLASDASKSERDNDRPSRKVFRVGSQISTIYP